jgi:hypothetical protein
VEKTLPSYRCELGREIGEWKEFAKALNPTEREPFEEMMDTRPLFSKYGVST